METTIVIGPNQMEKNVEDEMEAGGIWEFLVVIVGLYWDNGKEDENYCSILGLYWNNGKENGNYYNMLGLFWDNGRPIAN